VLATQAEVPLGASTVASVKEASAGLATAAGLVLTQLAKSSAPASAVPMLRVASYFSFNRWLDRLRAEDALVADKRDFGALPEDRVVMLDEGSCNEGCE